MLYVLGLEMFDDAGAMPINCLLYEDKMNVDIHKLYTYPNVIDELCEKYDVKIMIVKGLTKIGNITEEMIIPVVIANSQEGLKNMKYSGELAKLIQQPDTAIRAVIEARSDAGDTMLEILYDNFRTIRSTKKSTKVVVSKEHFLDEELARTMITNRPVFSIQPEKNVDIFQTSPTDTVCLALPSVYEIKESPTCISTLDVLNLVAPYRLQTKVSYGYMSIFHTPFFRNTNDFGKVYSQSALNSVDSKFRWLFGVARNNMLPLQQNEMQLAGNLETTYYNDVAVHMELLLTGIFYQSKTGRLLQKLEGLRKPAFIEAFQMFLAEMDPFIKCMVKMEDIFELDDEAIVTKQLLLDIFNGKIVMNQDGVMQLIDSMSTANHIIDCNYYAMSITFENLDDNVVVQSMIDNGFISKHMYEFLNELCMIAYRINWGHSATTKAIPGLVSSDKISEFDNKMVTKLNDVMAGKGTHRDIFKDMQNDDSDDEDDTETEDIEASFNQYLSNITITRIKNSTDGLRLLDDQSLLDALTPKEKIIERWRVINGESRLYNFINKGFTLYHNPKLLILAFIKLLRWGEERKPTMLIFPECPEIQTVYDLNESLEMQNIYLVSEDDIVLKDGCRYSIESALYTETKIINSNEAVIVGFVLMEDYGKIQKHYIASWSDMSTLITKDKCDISNLKLSYTDITDIFSKKHLIEEDMAGVDFFVTEDKIAESVNMNCQAALLSECALLVEKGITKSSEFIKSAKRSTILSLRDKQYDILHTYIRKLSGFYQKNSQQLQNLDKGCTANDLTNLILDWDSAQTTTQKPLHNEVVGENILNKLELGNKEDSLAYSEFSDLKNVALIIDMEMIAGLDPIIFEDKTLNEVSRMLENKIILCMGYTTVNGKECRVFFRNNKLKVADLQLKKNPETGKSTPTIYKYANVKQVLDRLKNIGYIDTQKFIYACDASVKGCI